MERQVVTDYKAEKSSFVELMPRQCGVQKPQLLDRHRQPFSAACFQWVARGVARTLLDTPV
jgi:hypothetical protein